MKRFLWLKHCSIVMLLILSLTLGAKEATDPLKDGLVHDQYKGVKFKISKSVIKEYNDTIKTITANTSKYPAGIEKDIPKLLAIQSNLSARFTEMVKSYNDNKSKLPSCLSNGLDRFLKELAAGTKSLDIWWLKGYPAWQYLTGNEDGTGESLSADTINIRTAFKKIMDYYPIGGEERYVLTESLLFHELVHTVKKVYPECFKKLGKNTEEISADWAEINIYTYKKAKTYYEDRDGDGTDQCTYEIVCKCKCEDKAGKKFRELASADSDDGCEPDPPDEGPAGDSPDDNYSYFRGIINEYNLAPEALIFTSGHWQEALILFGGLDFDENNTAEKLLKVTPVVIIPTGALSSMEYNSTFKYILEQYVNLGGTIIVFAQQYDTHIDNVVPVPEGETLKSYGWRQDSSCLRNSIYFESVHPALSSSTNELIDAGVDGYFSVYPSNSTILLRRKINLEPALLYYPYGNGTVILTSMFTDWAYAHSQSTSAELRIIRDLITFAKNPRLSIPMYDLAENPTPGVDLNVTIINKTDEPSTKARLVVFTPDREAILFETEAGVNLDAGESATIPVHFTLPALSSTRYGICHVDYELYNAENELIQLFTESDSGRFSIYKIITPVIINEGVYMWVTVKDENVYWGQDAEFTIHFKNTRSENRTLDINNPFFSIGHGGSEGPDFPSFQVILAPGEEYQHHVSLPTTQFNSYVKSSITVRIQYYDANGVLKQTGPGKTIFLKFSNF